MPENVFYSTQWLGVLPKQPWNNQTAGLLGILPNQPWNNQTAGPLGVLPNQPWSNQTAIPLGRGGAAFYWNSFWFIDIFFRFDSFHPFIISEFPMYTCHCPWSSPSDSLNCNCSLHGSSFCTHNSMPLLRFPVCRRQFLIASGGEMCVKGVDQTARFQGCEPGMFPK